MSNEEKILAMLEKLTSDMTEVKADITGLKTTQAEQGKQLAEQGKQLAELSGKVDKMDKEHGDRLRKIESAQENRIIPSLQVLSEGHSGLLETLAHKEDVEELKDAMVEWEAATKASYTELWNRFSKLEKAN